MPSAPAQPDRLAAGQGLRPGQVIRSQDGRFTLTLQGDGNLVAYGIANQSLWASNTAGHAGIWDAVMQGDGNLVAYDKAATALWASGTAGHAGATAVMQSDGNLVVYSTAGQALWASDSVVP